jgi:PAT family beta-lactamase induction signal transducer AmpG
MLIITLLACTGLNLPGATGLLTGVLLIHNSFGAMQDVAIDALAVNTCSRRTRSGQRHDVRRRGAGLCAGRQRGAVPDAGDRAEGRVCLRGRPASPWSPCSSCCRCANAPTPAADRRGAGLAAAGREMRHFAEQAFRSFLGTRGAYSGLFFALLPAGAMSLGLALQSNLAVEIGMSDDSVAWLSLWSQVVSAACMVIGGMDVRHLWPATHAVRLPGADEPARAVPDGPADRTPVDHAAGRAEKGHPRAPAALITAMWVATLAYAVAQG